MEGSMRCDANYVPLTPLSFLERSAIVHGDRVSIIYGSLKYTWKETRERCHRLASALTRLGISHGDVVAAMGPNIPAIYELHYGAPMAGGLICAITTQCDEAKLSDMINRAKPKIIFVDYKYLDVANGALELLSKADGTNPPLLIPIFEPNKQPSAAIATGSPFNPRSLDYESLLRSSDPMYETVWPKDEFVPISISFTSGTTATPKGVIHCHRAAYINSIATILLMEMTSRPVFLCTMPMYHCNGWSFIWGTATLGGVTVCFREVTAKAIFDAIVDHKATILAGTAPVLNMIVNASQADRKSLPHRVDVLMGGSPAPPYVLLKMEELGFRVTHAFGQTETYCCATYCSWKPEWDALPPEERAMLKARQGVLHHLLSEVDVKDPITMESVPGDGETIGEVVYRGNNVLCGYLDPNQTKEAFRGGWFHSGDLAVKHADGYIEMKDRLMDIVVSGGRNVGTIEVESMIFSHPAVLEAGVVGFVDEKLGDVVLSAFVKLKDGCYATAEDIIEFCRARLPEYKVPRTVVFDNVPLTSTGKIKKAVLREKAKALGGVGK